MRISGTFIHMHCAQHWTMLKCSKWISVKGTHVLKLPLMPSFPGYSDAQSWVWTTALHQQKLQIVLWGHKTTNYKPWCWMRQNPVKFSTFMPQMVCFKRSCLEFLHSQKWAFSHKELRVSDSVKTDAHFFISNYFYSKHPRGAECAGRQIASMREVSD